MEDVSVVVLGGWGVLPVGSPAEQMDVGGMHAWRRQWIAGRVVVEVVVGAAHCKTPPWGKARALWLKMGQSSEFLYVDFW